MTATCAFKDCQQERVAGVKGTESYCREHKNFLARQVRHAGKGPEVITVETCQRAGCDSSFHVSNWGQPQRYCGADCRSGAPKAARAAVRLQRQEAKSVEDAERTHKRCPGLPARDGSPAQVCGDKPVTEFHVVKGRLDTLCKEHRRNSQRRYEQRHGDKVRNRKTESARHRRMAGVLYGDRPMTDDDWDNEFIAQGSRCPLCLQEFTVLPDVDHDHETGQFRGLLCRRDNLKVHQDNDVAYALRLAEYVRPDRRTLPS